jgi:hypothetical protein
VEIENERGHERQRRSSARGGVVCPEKERTSLARGEEEYGEGVENSERTAKPNQAVMISSWAFRETSLSSPNLIITSQLTLVCSESEKRVR